MRSDRVYEMRWLESSRPRVSLAALAVMIAMIASAAWIDVDRLSVLIDGVIVMERAIEGTAPVP